MNDVTTIDYHKAKISVEDAIMSLYFICILAFFDVKVVFLGIQALVIAITFMNLIKKRVINIDYGEKIMLWIFIFATYCIVSLLWASDVNTTVISSTISIIQVALITYCAIKYPNNSNDNRVIYFFIIAAVVVCLRFFVTIPISQWGSQERFSKGTIFGSNGTSMTLAYAAVLTFWMLYKKIATRKTIKWLFSAFIIMFTFVSFLMGTRKSVIIISIGITLILLFSAKNLTKVIKQCLIILFFGIILYLVITKIDILYNSIGYRIESALELINGGVGDNSSTTREYLIKDGFSVFLNNPLVGIGQDGYRYANVTGYYAHNNYIELLANLGIVGFLIYYGYLFKVSFVSFKYFKISMLPSVLMIITFIVDWVSVSYSSELKYIIIAIIIISINNCKKQEQYE